MFDTIKRLIQRLGDVPNDEVELRNRVFSTYIWMRTGMLLIALAFPFGLVILGEWRYDVAWQDSMSAYYWAPIPKGEESGDAPMRIFFVGLLFTLSCCLILYKGYTGFEDWVLNIAGIFALCVALIPMCWKPEDECQNFSLHGAFAFGFFFLLALVAVLHGLWAWGKLRSRPGQRSEDQQRSSKYATGYVLMAAVMVLAPIVTWILFLTNPRQVFWAEFVGITAFCIFWGLQIVQIRSSGFDKDLAQSDIRVIAPR